MEKGIFTLIIIILIFDFLFERILDCLNSKTLKSKLPAELEGIYDDEKYIKSQDYKAETSRFSLISSSFSFILILLMLVFGGFAFVDDLVRGWVSHPILLSLAFFGILMFASDILGIPFDLYGTFVIEEKYGFNKTTPKIYILDKLKSWALMILIGGALFSLIIWFYLATGEMFWIYTWIAVSLFSIFMAMFYSSLIVPLFNKQTPLEDGELKSAIEDFCQKAGFKLDKVYVIDGSKRSTKANAYFTGLGSKKRIVLYDTLIKELTTEEIVAVLAHEIGHYKKKHIYSGLLLGLLQTGLMLFILSLFISKPELSTALGAPHSFHIALIVFGILYSPLSFIISIFMNILSRKNEYEADRFAKEHFKAEALASALKQLSNKNLSNLTPHPLYVFFHYSHPTLYQRLMALKN
jgi:STE24 endopeptidase